MAVEKKDIDDDGLLEFFIRMFGRDCGLEEFWKLIEREYKCSNAQKDDINFMIATLKGLKITTSEQACKKIGQKLNEIGGFALMRYVYELVYPNHRANDMRVLEMYWSGIGKWLG